MDGSHRTVLYVLSHLEGGNFDVLRQERINRELFIAKKTRDLQFTCNVCGLTFKQTRHQLPDLVSSLRFPVNNPSNRSRFAFKSDDLLSYIESTKPDLVVFKGLGYKLPRWLLLHSRHKFRFALTVAGGTEDPLTPFADYVLAETPAQIRKSFRDKQMAGKVAILPKLNLPGTQPLSDRKDFDIVNVGTFSWRKNQKALLPLADEYRLALVGDGELWKAVKEMAAPYGEAVFMPGNLPRTQVGSVIARSRLMVHTAHHEGLARVVMEAFACGVPVVASRRAMPEAFEHGIQGLLVEPDELLGAARELLADQGRLEAMGQAALKFANSRCTEEAVFEEILKMYEVVFSTPPMFTGSRSQILRVYWRSIWMKLLTMLKSLAIALGIKRLMVFIGIKK